ENAQIVPHDKTQRLRVGGLRPRTETEGEARGAGGHRKFPTRHPVSHSRPLPFGVRRTGSARTGPWLPWPSARPSLPVEVGLCRSASMISILIRRVRRPPAACEPCPAARLLLIPEVVAVRR